MKQNTDLRITKTDKIIKDTFIDLIDSIGFEKITVINLTKKAMISRTTFYSHYKDKYDLLEQIQNELLSGMKNIITENYSLENSSSFLFNIYKYVEDNKKIFKLFICNNIDKSFYFKFHESIRDLYNENINSSNFIEIPENYALAFITGVHTSIINEWIKSGMKESPEELVSIFINTLKNVSKKIYN